MTVTESAHIEPAYPRAAVEALYDDYCGLVSDLENASPSGLAALNRSYHKHLLVAAASSLEEMVKTEVPRIFTVRGGPQLATFFSKAVLARGYHALFDWPRESAQQFFSNFGPACAASFKRRLRENDELRQQHDSFMRLGNLRNQLVHGDYASKSIEMTPTEVVDRYRSGTLFVSQLENLIFVDVESVPGT